MSCTRAEWTLTKAANMTNRQWVDCLNKNVNEFSRMVSMVRTSKISWMPWGLWIRIILVPAAWTSDGADHVTCYEKCTYSRGVGEPTMSNYQSQDTTKELRCQRVRQLYVWYGTVLPDREVRREQGVHGHHVFVRWCQAMVQYSASWDFDWDEVKRGM